MGFPILRSNNSIHIRVVYLQYFLLLSGIEVTCTGNSGHSSRFIENTAVEKVVNTQP